LFHSHIWFTGSKFEEIFGNNACGHQLPGLTCLLLQVCKQGFVVFQRQLTVTVAPDMTQDAVPISVPGSLIPGIELMDLKAHGNP
jgi:hypothetical protein